MAGLGLFLIALGAILFWGVEAEIGGLDIDAIGVILMVIGAVGFVVGVVQSRRMRTRTERHVSADGQHVVEDTTTSGGA